MWFIQRYILNDNESWFNKNLNETKSLHDVSQTGWPSKEKRKEAVIMTVQKSQVVNSKQ